MQVPYCFNTFVRNILFHTYNDLYGYNAYINLVNQACAWFFKIISVQTSVCVCVCVYVRVLPEVINNYWRDVA